MKRGNAAAEKRKRLLKALVAWLEKSGVLKFDVDVFSCRLRLQKYVFLARFFGLDLGYWFTVYLRGPYSPGLASDYYALEGVEPAPLPSSFERERFLALVRGRDEKWLELASTALLLSEEGWSPEEIPREVVRIKPQFTVREVEKVVRELEGMCLLHWGRGEALPPSLEEEYNAQ